MLPWGEEEGEEESWDLFRFHRCRQDISLKSHREHFCKEPFPKSHQHLCLILFPTLPQPVGTQTSTPQQALLRVEECLTVAKTTLCRLVRTEPTSENAVTSSSPTKKTSSPLRGLTTAYLSLIHI